MIHFFIRVSKLILGLLLFALGIVLTIKGNLGYAPWDVFHWGIGNVIHTTIGNVSILVGILIGVIVTLLGEKLGLGTILNMVLIGVFINLLLPSKLIPVVNGLIPGIIFVILGLFVIAFGSYFYIKSGFGAGPRDSLMVAIKRKTKLPVGICRVLVEGTVFLIGLLLGGPVGIGTLISAFGIGFCVQIVFSWMRFEVTSVKHENFGETLRSLV